MGVSGATSFWLSLDSNITLCVAFAEVRFGACSLYGAIARLESRGLIAPLESNNRRNPYRLTALGEKALRARLASMAIVTRVGQRRLASV